MPSDVTTVIELGDQVTAVVSVPVDVVAVAQAPDASVTATVVPVIGPPGGPGEPDVDQVLVALEPPVALDVLYQNNLI